MTVHATTAFVPELDELALVELSAARARAGWVRLFLVATACAATALVVFAASDRLTAKVAIVMLEADVVDDDAD